MYSFFSMTFTRALLLFFSFFPIVSSRVLLYHACALYRAEPHFFYFLFLVPVLYIHIYSAFLGVKKTGILGM